MSRYYQGQPVTLSTTVKVAGVLTNAGALTLTIMKPDATTQAYPSPTNDSTGTYHQDVPAVDITLLGHYIYKWVSTGTGAGVSIGDFDIADPFEPAILPLQDAKDALNIPQTTTNQDAELQSMIDTVTASIEMITNGPAVTRSITERVMVAHNYSVLVLRKTPVVAVTSITDIASGVVLSIADLDIDLNAGIIRRKLQLPFWSWAISGYTVVYTAGWGTAIPPAFATAARIIVSHLWATQRGPAARQYGGEELTVLAGMSYAIPQRAAELLRPYASEAYV